MVKKTKSGSKGLGIFNILVLIFNIIVLAALLLSYLAVHVSPEKNHLLPFFGLVYPYLVLINLFFMIYWMFRRRWLFVLSFIGVFAGWNHISRTFQVGGGDSGLTIQNQFKVITYNVKNLSNDNVDMLEPSVRNKIVSFLEMENADLVCMQEFAVVHPDPDAFIDSLSVVLDLPYHAHSLYHTKPRRLMDAISIFTRFPILREGPINKDYLHNYGLYADIYTGKDTIRIVNVHLESIRLKHEDYKFISKFDLQFEEDENVKESSKRIFNKLSIAYETRAMQVDTLVSFLKTSPYPVILCGDFNDTPNSYTYQQLSSRLEDAFIESGKGFGNTYVGNLPSFRIDYILYDDRFIARDYTRLPVRYSDHYPISCWFGLR